MDNAKVETLASSVVREYLYRKGFTRTLEALEKECPRRAGSIGNRVTLVREMHLDRLMKTNKMNRTPLRSVVEVMTRFFAERKSSSPSASKIKERGYHPLSTPQVMSRSSTATLRDVTSGTNIIIHKEAKVTKLACHSAPQPACRSPAKPKLGRHQQHGYGKSRSYNEYDGSEASGYNADIQQPEIHPRAWEHKQEDKVDGPSSSTYNNNNGNGTDVPDLGIVDDYDDDDEVPDAVGRTKRNSIDIGCDILRSKKEALVASNKLQNEVHLEECPASLDKTFKILGIKPKETAHQHTNNNVAPSSSEGVRVGDLLLFDDLDMESSSWSPPSVRRLQGFKNKATVGKPVTHDLGCQLRQLMFGNTTQTFSSGWLGQGFTFSNHPKVLYGIVQKKGGPCGVLAAVQSYVLKAMIYGSETKPEFRARDPLSPSAAETRMALALALCDILWMCGQRTKATLAMSSCVTHMASLGRYHPDGVTETMILHEFTDRELLQSHLQSNIGHFMKDGGHGCILAIYSAIISRGIEAVKEDMDVSSGTLMGAHGYCTQEMVNLLLTGNATSNVFDNIIELDSGGQDKAVLKGIQHSCDIGFLSLFEHYNSCEVGSNLKCPRFPVWVVCSESHFSVLFSTRKELVEDWRHQPRFDLYYYDGLAKQEDQIRLTVDTTRRISRSDEDLVPPLENCIQTKWKAAAVDWNGFEPIL